MSFEIQTISHVEFNQGILKNKDAILWFIWYTRKKIEGITFYSLKSDNIEIGLCFFIENNEAIEVGILIHQSLRQKGFGSIFISHLIEHRHKQIVFKVSKYNLISLAFFQKFVNRRQLNKEQLGVNTLFSTEK
jgi:GNAT superfamily N-acetyltransferase